MIYCTVPGCCKKTVDGTLCAGHLNIKMSARDKVEAVRVPSEGMLEKIKKLLALAQDKCNVNESALAAQMAQRLLAEHNLSIADLPQERQERCEPDVMDGVEESWERTLGSIVARANYCRAVHSQNIVNGDRKFILVGRPSNVQVVKYLYAYLRSEISKLADHAKRTQGQGDRSFKSGFINGCLHEVKAKLNAMKQVETSSCTALTVRLDQEAEDKMHDIFPRLRTTRATCRINAGYGAGQRAGRNMGIHAGVTANTNHRGQALLA
jgi:hypothetical protein